MISLIRHSTNRDRGVRPQEDRNRPSAASRTASPPPREDTPSRASPAPSGGSYSSYKTPEDRAVYIKQQAEQRMAERLAALGLRAPAKGGESTDQKQEREKKEREDRLKQEEAEDARREQERQKRLADEQVTPPSAGKPAKKPPPAPPSRKSRSDSLQKQQDFDTKRLEQEAAERVIKEQQEAQEAESLRMRYILSFVVTAILADGHAGEKNNDNKMSSKKNATLQTLDVPLSRNKCGRAR